MCICLFLGSQFYSVNLCVGFYANTILFNYYCFFFKDFSHCSDGKESSCNVGDLSSIPELGRSPKEENRYPFQYSGLGNPHGQRSLAGYSPWGCFFKI